MKNIRDNWKSIKMINKDWIFKTDEYICALRSVGVLVRDGKLLVQRDRDVYEYALPGGHVKIGVSYANIKKKPERIFGLEACSGRKNAFGIGTAQELTVSRFTIESN